MSIGFRFTSAGRLMRLVSLSLVLLVAPGLLQAADSLTLRDLEATSLGGGRVQLVLSMSGAAPEPVSFTIDRPARLALDFAGVVNGLAKRNHSLAIGPVLGYASAEARGRTRLVINLSQAVPYQTRVEGNQVVVILDASSLSNTAAAVLPATVAPAASSGEDGDPASGWRVDRIDFRRGELGEGRIEIDLNEPGVVADMSTEGERLVITFGETAIRPRLIRRLEVTDFATPVTAIETDRRGNSVRMVVETTGEFDHFAYQSDNRYILEVKPLVVEEGQEGQKKAGYSGERLSLNFQNIEVRAVLQLIAEFTGFNVVVADTVGGSVTLRLNSVPWDQAMDIILQSKGLSMRQEGNVIMVAPAGEIAEQERIALESRTQNQALAPLRSEFIQVNYARASEMASLIQSEGVSLLSSRGNITVDERTNTLLVQDTAESIDEVRRMITRLDIPVRQVMIESRIVVADDSFSRDLGVRFGVTGMREHTPAGTGITNFSGSGEGADAMNESSLGNLRNTGTPFPVDLPDQDSRYNVNLPVASAGRFGMAILGVDYLLDLELSAMQSEGRGEILSNPRVVTGNNQTATISQGQTIQFLSTTSDGSAVQPIRAQLSLSVTPQVTPNDRVLMRLDVTDDSADSVAPSVAVTNNRGISTNVLVGDGETLVLGGIYQESRRDGVTKVPLLGDLPGVGALFRSKTRSNNKQELLVFVTPRILREGLTLR